MEPGKLVDPSGTVLKKQNSESIGIGKKVRNSLAEDTDRKTESHNNVSEVMNNKNEFQWSVFIPLAFGGKRVKIKLDIFEEKNFKNELKKSSPTIYFLITIQTEKQGEIHWRIYLKGFQVAIQVYAPVGEITKGNLSKLITEVETSLKNKGYFIMTPTVILNRPLTGAAGFRLNVKR